MIPKETPAAVPAPKLLAAVLPSNFHPAEQVRYAHSAIVPSGADKAYIENEANWAHVAANSRLHDRFEIWSEDGRYYAEAVSLDVGTAFIKLRVLNDWTFDAYVPKEVGSDYSIEFAGIAKKWRVVRKKDSKELRSGFANQTEAATWALNHSKAMAA